jgi:hypothetical protein
VVPLSSPKLPSTAPILFPTTMSNHPLTGKPAPVLSLPNADGTTYELKPGAEGKPTAVFFYPKAGAYPLSTSSFRLSVTSALHRYLWLHERSLRFPGCAQWSALTTHDEVRETNDCGRVSCTFRESRLQGLWDSGCWDFSRPRPGNQRLCHETQCDCMCTVPLALHTLATFSS